MKLKMRKDEKDKNLEENEHEEFRARVTSRGEVLMTNLSSRGVGRKSA